MKKVTHILIILAAAFLTAGCKIYSDDAVCDTDITGMRLMFNISARNPESAETRTSYGTPSLENGTEWENYVDIAGNDYLFYLFDDKGIFQETLSVWEISTEDNITYNIIADVRNVYTDFTIVALLNWRTDAWDMLSDSFSYPVLDKGVSSIEEIWTDAAGVRVYDNDSRTFAPSETNHIPMYGARTYSLSSSSLSNNRIDLETLYLIRSVAKVDVYVSGSSGLTLNSVQLNCFSNYFHCAPVGMTAMDDQWSQATDETMNLTMESFSPSILDFNKIDDNVFRLYIPEYPNKREGLDASTISVSMTTKDGSLQGATIYFKGKENASSTEETTLNILRNNYYKFCITGLTEYETDIIIDVVPFDNISNDLIFE